MKFIKEKQKIRGKTELTLNFLFNLLKDIYFLENLKISKFLTSLEVIKV